MMTSKAKTIYVIVFLISITASFTSAFRCTPSSNNFEADPESCKNFYRCVNGQTFKFSCPFPLNFDKAVSRCSRNKCELTEPPQTTTSGSTSTEPQASSTNVVTTNTGSITSSSSDNPLITSASTTSVVHSSPAGNTEGDNPGTTCMTSGYIADRKNCFKYFHCVFSGWGYTAHSGDCVKGTAFNPASKTCEEAAFESCALIMPTELTTQGPTVVTTQGPTVVTTQGPTVVTTQGPTVVTTQGPGGVSTGVPGGVSTEVPGGVSTGVPGGVSTGVPGGVSTGVPGGVSTESPSEGQQNTTQPRTSSGTKSVCNASGLFPDDSDCSKYIQCIDGGWGFISYIRTCEAGKMFDSVTRKCEVNAVCSTPSATTEPSSGTSEGTDLPTGTDDMVTSVTEAPIATTDPTFVVTTEPSSEVTTEPISEVTTEPSSEVTTEPSVEVTTEVTTEPSAEVTTEVTTGPSIEVTTEDSTAQTDSPTDSTDQPTTTSPVVTTDDSGTSECVQAGFFRHPSNCNRFYRCVDWAGQGVFFTKFNFNCPEGLAFDDRYFVCNWPDAVPGCGRSGGDLSTSATTGVTETTVPQPTSGGSTGGGVLPSEGFPCPATGFFRNPNSCNKFYRCTDTNADGLFRLYHFSCPDNLVWDESSTTCNWPYAVPSCFSSSVTTPSTTNQTGPDGGATTVNPGTDLTAAPSETNTTTTPATLPDGIICDGQGLRRYPALCSMFYECTNTDGKFTVTILSCTEGLVFDEGSQTCQSPNNTEPCIPRSCDKNETEPDDGGFETTTSIFGGDNDTATDDGDFMTTSETADANTTATDDPIGIENSTATEDPFGMENSTVTEDPFEGDNTTIPDEVDGNNSTSAANDTVTTESSEVVTVGSLYDCPTPGHFEFETDCIRFYRCIETEDRVLKGLLYKCPDGYIFDKSLLNVGFCRRKQPEDVCDKMDNGLTSRLDPWILESAIVATAEFLFD